MGMAAAPVSMGPKVGTDWKAVGRAAQILRTQPVPAAGTGHIPRTAAVARMRRVMVGAAVRRRALPSALAAVLAGQ